jgi:hypothetical protein
MSAANPNPMEKSMVSVLVVANAGGGSPLPCGVQSTHEDEDHICMIDERQIYSITYQEQQFAGLNSKMDRLLQKMGAAWTKNTALHEAYHASRQETALLRAAVATLMKTLNKNIAISTPP